MLTLTINGLPAVVKTGSSFKLTRQNPYFEVQGDYTFEVTLPLAGCLGNRRIFGALDHTATAVTPEIGKKYEMQLIAPPLALQGTAEIVSITEEEVKVQLTAGVLDFAHSIEDTEVYIDALDLGNAWDGFEEFSSGGDTWEPGLSRMEMGKIFSIKPGNVSPGGFTVEQMMHGIYGQTDAVCFPIYAKSDSLLCNPHVYTSTTSRLALYAWDAETGTYYPTTDSDTENVAAQPYLADILQRIIVAVGYEVGDISLLTDTWRKNIIIANSRCTIARAATLPHWTMAELIEELQNFFGGVFVVSGKKVSFLARSKWYGDTATFTELSRVSDEHTTEIDPDGEQTTSSAGNVDYDWAEDDDILQLPTEVWESAERQSYSSLALITAAVAALSDEERKKSRYLYEDTSTGYFYALLHRADDQDTYELVRVNQCGALFRNAETYDVDVSLRCMPARMVLQRGAGADYGDPTSFIEGTVADGVPILAAADTSLTVKSWYSIDSAINPDSAESDDSYTDTTKERLELAYYDGSVNAVVGAAKRLQMAVPCGVLWVTDPDSGLLVMPDNITDPSAGRDPSQHWYLLNVPKDDEYNDCIGLGLTGAATIDTRAEISFDIYDNFPTDPTAAYLIGGKRFAAQKFEITLNEEGIKFPIVGTFHEISKKWK